MKFKIIILTYIIITLNSCKMNAQVKINEPKILIAYYSYSGNTEIIAKQIQTMTGGDIYRIVPKNEYPKDYNAVVNQAKDEIKNNFKPELISILDSLYKYDVIFVGSPNWWSTFAPPVATFLTSYKFEGKIIIPFITHEGSGLGIVENDLRKLCPNSKFYQGLAIRGSNVNKSEDVVLKWLNSIPGIIK